MASEETPSDRTFKAYENVPLLLPLKPQTVYSKQVLPYPIMQSNQCSSFQCPYEVHVINTQQNELLDWVFSWDLFLTHSVY